MNIFETKYFIDLQDVCPHELIPEIKEVINEIVNDNQLPLEYDILTEVLGTPKDFVFHYMKDRLEGQNIRKYPKIENFVDWVTKTIQSIKQHGPRKLTVFYQKAHLKALYHIVLVGYIIFLLASFPIYNNNRANNVTEIADYRYRELSGASMDNDGFIYYFDWTIDTIFVVSPNGHVKSQTFEGLLGELGIPYLFYRLLMEQSLSGIGSRMED